MYSPYLRFELNTGYLPDNTKSLEKRQYSIYSILVYELQCPKISRTKTKTISQILDTALMSAKEKLMVNIELRL